MLFTPGARTTTEIKTVSLMISLPPLLGLFPPLGFEDVLSTRNHNARRVLWIGVALIVLSVFPASFSSPLTGSITWRASIRNVSDANVVGNMNASFF
jgi:hypothetical protein